MNKKAKGLVGIFSLLVISPLLAEDVNECDRLVSHPLDPDRVTDGVSTADVDHPKGIAACLSALKDDPENPRFNYQLGRVYFYDGKPNNAMPHLEAAAAAGYRQAQFVLGYIHDTGSQGVTVDRCKTESLWAAAAKAGRLAAMVSYPHHVLRGRFSECDVSVSHEEMMGFLDKAKERRLDYYQNMLVNDLVTDLQAANQ